MTFLKFLLENFWSEILPEIIKYDAMVTMLPRPSNTGKSLKK